MVPLPSAKLPVLLIVRLPAPPAFNVPVPVIVSVSVPTVPDATERSELAASTVPSYSLVPLKLTVFGVIATFKSPLIAIVLIS